MENPALPDYINELIPLFPYFLIPFQLRTMSLVGYTNSAAVAAVLAVPVAAAAREGSGEAPIVRATCTVLLTGPVVVAKSDRGIIFVFVLYFEA